ncbi:MAG: hypothetical protein JW902_03620 [Syntrophaceae bacterium]|nr:hypothetical protein [Syntrophaceae bacterium]
MKRIDEHEDRIETLEEEIRNLKALLFGKPRGPITMREARLANERGEKALVRQYIKQLTEQYRKSGDISFIMDPNDNDGRSPA